MANSYTEWLNGRTSSSSTSSGASGTVGNGANSSYLAWKENRSSDTSSSDISAKIEDNRRKVSEWAAKYNDVINRYNSANQERNNGWSNDVSGGTSEDISSLINDYDYIRSYARYFGIGNEAVQGLQSMSAGIEQGNKYYSQWENADQYNAYLKDQQEKQSRWVDPGVTASTEQEYQTKVAALLDTSNNSAEAVSYRTRLDESNKHRYGNYQDAVKARDAAQEKIDTEMMMYHSQAEWDAMYAELDAAQAEVDRLVKYGDDKTVYDSNNYHRSGQDVADKYAGAKTEAGWNAAMEKAVSSDSYDASRDVLGRYLSAVENPDVGVNVYYDANGDAHNSDIDYGDSRHFDMLSEGEKNTYYTLMSTGGDKAASDYLDELQLSLDYRWYQKDRLQEDWQELQNMSTFETLLYDAASVPQSVLGSIPAAVDDIVRLAQGKEINPYSNAHKLKNEADRWRSERSEYIDSNERKLESARAKSQSLQQQIDEAADEAVKESLIAQLEANDKVISDLEQKIANGQTTDDSWMTWGDVYQACMSTADSLFGSMFGGTGYGIMMGMGAADSTAKDMYEQGATTAQIVGAAVAAGVAEQLFETLSMEYFTEKITKYGAKNAAELVRNILLQGAAEGSEEFFTEIANTITNAVFAYDFSDYKADIDAYKEKHPGASDAQARSYAIFRGMGSRALKAAASGALSGGMMGVSGSTQGYLQNRASGQRIIDGANVSEIIKGANDVYSDMGKIEKFFNKGAGKTAANLQTKLDNGTLTSADATAVGQVYNMFQEGIVQNDIGKITEAAQKQMEQYGEAGNRAAASAIAKTVAGEDLTFHEKDALKRSEVAQKVLSEIESLTGEELTNLDRKVAITERVIPAADSAAESMNQYATAREQIEAGRVANAGYSSEAKASYARVRDESDETRSQASKLKSDARQAADDAVKARDEYLSNPTRAWAANINTTLVRPDSFSRADIDYQARKYGKHAEAFKAAYHGGNVMTYANDWNQAFMVGVNGGNMESIRSSGYSKSLTDAQLSAAYHSGAAETYRIAVEQYGDKFTSILEDGQNRTKAALEYHMAYQAALNGKVTLKEVNESCTTLTDKQVKEAYNAGHEEAIKNGTVRDDRSKWYAEKRGEQQGKDVSERAGTSTEERADSERAAAKRREETGFDGHAAGEEVSSKQLGFKNGIDDKRLRLVSHSYTQEFQEFCDLADSYGFNVIGVESIHKGDYIELSDRKARGVMTFDAENGIKQIVVCVNALDTTAEQVGLHELTHGLIKLGMLDVDAVLKKFNRTYGDHLQTICDAYMAAGSSDVKDTFEEIICDAMAGMNVFSRNPLKLDLNKFMSSVRKETERNVRKIEKSNSYDIAGSDDTDPMTNPDVEPNTDVDDVSNRAKMSYVSLAQAAGFEAFEDIESGIRYFVKDGKKVYKEITAADIEDSPIGALINFSLEMGDFGPWWSTEAKDAARKQMKFFADICNTANKINDFSLTMRFVGSSVFMALKSNADKQYGTTFDFGSICTKTLAMIENMSAAMVAAERGLNSDEITNIAEEVFATGNPITCPECYVFTHWIGIGGLLDKMWKYQNTFASMTVEEVNNYYNKLNDDLKMEQDAMQKKWQEMYAAATTKDERDALMKRKPTRGRAKGSLKKRLESAYNNTIKKLEEAEKQGDTVTAEALRHVVEDMEPQVTTIQGMTWIDTVYFTDETHKNARPKSEWFVPSNVLFDLTGGEEFASKYQAAWGFRTTQGAGYGKAITPVADAVLGEGIIGTNGVTNAAKAKANGTLDNLFLRQRGHLDNDSRKKLLAARKKQLNQAFLGGQRFQSTSDAVYENSSDYLLAFLEAQAMHSMAQIYTKVPGCVDSLATWGGSVNMSMMPLGSGLDRYGQPIDTSVGGMSPEAAKMNRLNNERAGTITIGVNDAHIRALFNQYWRDFIIPYHASGGKVKVINALRTIQDRDSADSMVRSTDYTGTQNDKVLSDIALRWKITQENPGISEKEIKDKISRIHAVREARINILTGNAKPNMEVVKSSRFLTELYDRLYGDTGKWRGVQLGKGVIEDHIFPNEFWDESVSYDDSAKITQDYLDYCDELGFLHRFSGMKPRNGIIVQDSGYDRYGNKVKLTDLAYQVNEDGTYKLDKDGKRIVEPFFWKTLTDRRMFDNDGNYMSQDYINLTGSKIEHVTEFAKGDRFGAYAGREYNKAASMRLQERIRDAYRTEKHSTVSKADDDRYLELAKDPEKNRHKLETLVERAARKAGYNSPILFHGTEKFGFTKIDVQHASDDHISFFATSSDDLAGSYAWNASPRDIHRKEISIDEWDEITGKAYWKYNQEANKVYNIIDQIGGGVVVEYAPFIDAIDQAAQMYWDFHQDSDELIDDIDVAIDHCIRDSILVGDDELLEKFKVTDEYKKLNVAKARLRNAVQKYGDLEIEQRNYKSTNGIYSLYANTDNMLTVSGNFNQWSEINSKQLGEEANRWLGEYRQKHRYRSFHNPGTCTTRELAAWAKHIGKSGVIISDLYDNGGKALGKNVGSADVYIFLNPTEQVKSADPVTYDDDGNVIPLSKRFNDQDNDIRYSTVRTGSEFGDDTYQVTKDMFDVIAGIRNKTIRWDDNAFKQVLLKYPEYDFIVQYANASTTRARKEVFDRLNEMCSTLTEHEVRVLSSFLTQTYSSWTGVGTQRNPMEAGMRFSEMASMYKGAAKKLGNDMDKIAKSKTIDLYPDRTNVNVKSGKTDLKTVKELFYKLNTDQELTAVADKVFAVAETLPLDYKFMSLKSDNANGLVIGDKVRYDTSAFAGKPRTDQARASTILHEMIHACTSYALYAREYKKDAAEKRAEFDRANLYVSKDVLDKYWDDNYSEMVGSYDKMSKDMRDAVDILHRLYNAAMYEADTREHRTDIGKAGELYGLKDEHEMLAELANPKFRAWLKAKQLFKKIMGAIEKFFGIGKVDANAKAATSAVLEKMLENVDQEAFNRWRNFASKASNYSRYSTVAARTEQHNAFENPAVHINDSGVAYTDLILSGAKTMETRLDKSGKGTSQLDDFIGKRVAIVKTGKGKAQVVGYMTITGKKVYENEKQFRKDYKLHKVPQIDRYGWKNGAVKIGYYIDPKSVVKLDQPITIGGNGYVPGDFTARNLEFSEEEATGGKQKQNSRHSTVATTRRLYDSIKAISQDEIESNIYKVSSMSPVAHVEDIGSQYNGVDEISIYRANLPEIGSEINTSEFGSVSIRNTSIHDDIRHGSTKEKLASISAIQSVLNNGKIVDIIKKYDNLYRVTVAAPIEIGNKLFYMGVMLQTDNNVNRLYIHDVIMNKATPAIDEGDLVMTGPSHSGRRRFMTNVLQLVNYVKYNDTFGTGLDEEYQKAVESGDIEKAVRMLKEKAARVYAETIEYPDVTTYSVRRSAPPKRTIKVYKTFTVDSSGRPTALFVSSQHPIPIGMWLEAQDTFHFMNQSNGLWYVPSTKNPNTAGGATGKMIPLSSISEADKTELEKRGYIKRGKDGKFTASSITALAYRPGWHAGDLPFFPQGGMQIEGSNYKNVHRYNQVVFECEMSADNDYTTFSETDDGGVRYYDRQEMPSDGYYKFATNPMANSQDIGAWFISSSLKIVRPLTEQECNSILSENNRAYQEWQQYQDPSEVSRIREEAKRPYYEISGYKKNGEPKYKLRDAKAANGAADAAVAAYEKRIGNLDFKKLHVDPLRTDAYGKLLEPTYDDDGNLIPFSQRMDITKMDQRYSTVSTTQLAAENQEAYEDVRKQLGSIQKQYEDRVMQAGAAEEKVAELEAALDEEVKQHKSDNDLLGAMWTQEAEQLKKMLRQSNGKLDVLQQKVAERDQHIKELRERIAEERKESSKDMSIMEREFMRVTRAYEAAADKSTTLEQALKEELKNHKGDAATWEREFKRLSREYDKAGRSIDKLEQQVKRQQDRAHQKVIDRKRTEVRHKILDLNKKFQQMLDHPTQNSYAPRELITPLAEFCQMFAQSEQIYRYNQAFQARQNGTSETYQRQIAKATELLQQAADRYGDMQGKEGLTGASYNEDTAAMIQQVTKDLRASLEYETIHDMSLEDLQAVYSAMKGVLHQIETANQLSAMEKTKTVVEAVQRYEEAFRDVTVKDGASAVWQRYNMWQMRPDTFFDYICGYAKDNVGLETQRMFVQGTENMLRIRRDQQNLFAPILDNKSYKQELRKMNSTKEKDLVHIGLLNAAGEDVGLTRGMMLSVYMHLNQQDSIDSLVHGGFSLPRMDEYYKGNVAASYGGAEEEKMRTTSEGASIASRAHELQVMKKTLKQGMQNGTLTSDAIRQIENRIDEIQLEMDNLVAGEEYRLYTIRNTIEDMLTPMERELVEAAREWMKHSGDLMAETYYELNGFDPKRVDNYWAIHRDATQIVSLDTTSVINEYNLSGAGFTKERVHGRQPILLTDFFAELGTNVEKMSRYCGFATVQRDFNKMYKFKLAGSMNTMEGHIRYLFQSGNYELGVSGTQYIDNYLKAVSGANQADHGPLGFLYSAAAGSTLMANARVSLSQFASVPTAIAEVGCSNAAKGVAAGIGQAFSRQAKDKLAQESEWFWTRYNGEGANTELADLKHADGIWGTVANSRAGKALLNWCQNMDVLATGPIMWNMAKADVESTGLNEGDEGYEDAVKRRYSDIIRRSQPNYTDTERSDLLRDKRGVSKILTMYKTQSNQNLNILIQANGRYSKYVRDLRDGKNGVTQADVDACRKQLANAYTGVVVGGTLAFALIRFLGNALQRTVNAYRDDDDEVSAEGILNGILKDSGSSLAGMFALGSQIYDFAYSAMSGEYYYGISDSAIGMLSDLTDNAMKLISAAKDSDTDKMAKYGEKTLFNALSAAGVPAKNFKTLITAMTGWYGELATGTLGAYESDGSSSSSSSGSTWMTKASKDKYVKALLKGDEEKAGKIMAAWIARSEEPNDFETKNSICSTLTSTLQSWYLDGKLDEATARSIMEHQLEMGKTDIDEKLASWNGKLETGYTLQGAQKAYMAGEYSTEQIIDYLMKYQSMSDKEAKAKELEHRCQRDEGIEYAHIDEMLLHGLVTGDRAKSLYQKYGGYEKEKAATKVDKLLFQKETGSTWTNVEDALKAGAVSEDRLKYWYKTILGYNDEKAEKAVNSLKFKVQTGYSWNDRDDAYAAGVISYESMYQWYKTMGYNDEKAQEKAQADEWDVRMPNATIADSYVANYYEYAQPTGVSMQAYYDFYLWFKDVPAGQTKRGKQEVAGYINSMNISDAQKKALWLSFKGGWKYSGYRWGL